MLAGLRLHNIALIDSLELDFEPGLWCSPVKPSWKSLLLDALDAVSVECKAPLRLAWCVTVSPGPGLKRGLTPVLLSKPG